MKSFVIFLCGLLLSINLFAQDWEKYYEHDKKIDLIAVSEDQEEFAFTDENGLHIFYEEEWYSYDKFQFTIETVEFNVDYQSVSSLDYLDGDLYVSTKDSIISLFEHGQFIQGLLAYQITHKTDNHEYVAVLYLHPLVNTAGQFVGNLDIRDLEFEPWYYNHETSPIADYPIRDLAIDEKSLFLSEDGKTIVVFGYASNTHFNSFTFSSLPFNRLYQIENHNLVPYNNLPERHRMHVWATTDHGMALYISKENHGDFENWTEDGWQHFSKDNSGLLTNDLIGLDDFQEHRLDTEHKFELIAWSNDPYPTVYHIDGWHKKFCNYNPTNSNMKDIPIDDLHQNGDSKLYIVQDKTVYGIDLKDYLCEEATAANSTPNRSHNINILPNPGTNWFKIEAEYFDVDQVKIVDLLGNIYYPVKRGNKYYWNGPSGMYNIVIEQGEYEVVKKWVKYK